MPFVCVCLFVCLFVQTWPIVNGVRCDAAVESSNNQAEFDRRTDGRMGAWTDRLLGSFLFGSETN